MSGPFGSSQWMYSSGREFYEFPIEQSLRFNDNDSAYLSWTPASAGNRKTWTWSGWVKRGNLGLKRLFTAGTSGSSYIQIRFDTNDEILCSSEQPSLALNLKTTQKFRDLSAWYHIVVAMDTTQSTAADRTKLYINGSLVTDFSSSTRPAQNTDLLINSTTAHMIGALSYGVTSDPYDGYMADVNFIDGQALDPTSFGELKSGIWIPKDTSGLTFGTNGFRLQFGDTTEASGFNALTWTGNDVAGHAINGCGFSPDLVWIKNRDVAEVHNLNDTVRGAGLQLFSNNTDAEFNRGAFGLTSFNSDGFSLGVGGEVNDINEKYVAWCWDAGSGSPVSNTDGSITSTVKANTDYGFSITSYVGTGANATVGHGLTSAPDMIIAKRRNTTGSWGVYHSGMTSATYQMWLDLTNGETSRPAQWNSTAPTSSVFSIGTDTDVNASGSDYIAYCFAEKTGYSKFGTYSGTGAAGNSITGLGFKPAFLLAKRINTTANWGIWDNTRDTSNPITKYFVTDLPNVEGDASSVGVDFDDDGFTFQGGSALGNASGGTYIYMAFADTRNAAFWRDTSGQGNDWQPNNLVFNDVVPDSTTNNFANLMIHNFPAANSNAFSEGNLRFSAGTGDSARNTNRMAISNMLVSSGKWYAEAYIVDNGSAHFIGVGPKQTVLPTANNTRYAYIYSADGTSYVRTGASEVISTYASSYTVGDVIGIYVDMDAATPVVYFSKNGQWSNGSGSWNQSSPSSGITLGDTFFTESADFAGTFTFQAVRASSAVSPTTIWNFGQDSTFAGNEAAGGNADANGIGDFFSTVPDDALALCTANLPTGAINTLNDETPEDYFGITLYNGTLSSTGTADITHGLSFTPDFVWTKSRSAISQHILRDIIRGANNALRSEDTAAESDKSGNGNMTSLATSTTFSTNYTDGLNVSGKTYVGWSWKAGGTGVSNTDGSITSTVSVGATSQQNWFSIVSYTGNATAGATVGHGLDGTVPDMIIVKSRDNARDWRVYHSSLGSAYTLDLNTTNAVAGPSTAYWNSTDPTSSVFSIGSVTTVNGSGEDYIAYCFANAEGLCRAGSYVGNGSADGTFVFTGFRPAFVLLKKSSASGDNWSMYDNKRDTDNTVREYLIPNSSQAAGATDTMDFVSNGFKVRNSGAYINTSGSSYIYLALAEQPFKYANAR